MRVARPVSLAAEQRQRLEAMLRCHTTPHRLVFRARTILGAAEGKQNKVIAAELGTRRGTVQKWRDRFLEAGLDGLLRDAPRPGRPPKHTPEEAREIVRRTLETRPQASTHWSTRTLAKAMGLPRMRICRVWQANQLKPHLTRRFKISKDPRFAEKVVDIVGLYLNPPEHALVLSVDEKSQIQALDRTQPAMPLMPKYCATHTHDYVRHGTTTLFAALGVADGRVISACMERHRHQEWLRFLRRIDRETDRSLDLHLIVDNYATHKHAAVRAWLAKYPRFHLHFTPTSASWLNVVERWFGELTNKRLRRGSFFSTGALTKAINEYVEAHNADPQAFHWTAKAATILEKVDRARAILLTNT
jgi:transposase